MWEESLALDTLPKLRVDGVPPADVQEVVARASPSFNQLIRTYFYLLLLNDVSTFSFPSHNLCVLSSRAPKSETSEVRASQLLEVGK